MVSALNAKNVSAVLVTKGDQNLTPVLDSLPFTDVVIWDNSKRDGMNLLVYGRYAAINEAKHDLLYTQDDDCVVDVEAVIAAFEPGKVICNMPENKRQEYERLAPGIGLVGWGACFDRSLVTTAFATYFASFRNDELFLREADRVFTGLNRLKIIDVPFRHLPHAFENRMANEQRHFGDLQEIRKRVESLR